MSTSYMTIDDASHANSQVSSHNENADPHHIDGILSRELMKLSVKDRNDFQEEIHGVSCIAPKETPEFVRDSLEKLQIEIDDVIPVHQKQAYLQSQQPPCGNDTYVNTEAFRLRFLRCELFDIPKAAARLTKFLNLAQELYGDYALHRPIRLSDFTEPELRHLRKGRLQYLPYRDRCGIAGRKVLCFFLDEEWETFPPFVRSKMVMYFTWVAGNDIDVQKEGIVVIIWFDPFKVPPKPAFKTKPHETPTVRACAIHCCTPDTPLYRILKSILTMRIGKNNWTRFVSHLGSSVELQYQLQAYGIPSEHIPTTPAGKIKAGYLKQWLALREALEENNGLMPIYNGMGTAAVVEGSGLNIIESPYLSDIIFRKGASLMWHPGNATLRSLIVAKAREELEPPTTPQPTTATTASRKSKAKTTKKAKTRIFVTQIIHEIREFSRTNATNGTGKACRFLVWNEDAGWWEQLFQEQDIHTRVEYIARGIRNTVAKTHKASQTFRQTAAANTNVAPSSLTTKATAALSNLTTKLTTALSSPSAAMDTSSPSAPSPSVVATAESALQVSLAIESPIGPIHPSSTTNDDASKSLRYRTSSETGTTRFDIDPRGLRTQLQKGGTNLFRSLDNSGPPTKRRLLVKTANRMEYSSCSDASSDEEDNNFCCAAECFGRKFHDATSNNHEPVRYLDVTVRAMATLTNQQQ